MSSIQKVLEAFKKKGGDVHKVYYVSVPPIAEADHLFEFVSRDRKEKVTLVSVGSETLKLIELKAQLKRREYHRVVFLLPDGKILSRFREEYYGYLTPDLQKFVETSKKTVLVISESLDNEYSAYLKKCYTQPTKE